MTPAPTYRVDLTCSFCGGQLHGTEIIDLDGSSRLVADVSCEDCARDFALIVSLRPVRS